MDTNNILSPRAILSLPSFIVYGLINKTDKKFLIFGTTNLLAHYGKTLHSFNKNDPIKTDIFNNKIECLILETMNDYNNIHYDMNCLLLVGKAYDALIKDGYTPYRNHRFMRIEIKLRKQPDGKVNMYAETTRGTNIFLGQFINMDLATEYKKRWYGQENIYRLYQYNPNS